MSEKSHLTMKEASELTGFPYPAIKQLLEFAGMKIEKQGSSLVCNRDDVETTVLALRIAFAHPDDASEFLEKAVSDIKEKKDDAGFFILDDNKKYAVKRCPFCGSDKLVLRPKYLEDKNMCYAFVQCKKCKASSGSSGAYTDPLISEMAAIEIWNNRPSKG